MERLFATVTTVAMEQNYIEETYNIKSIVVEPEKPREGDVTGVKLGAIHECSRRLLVVIKVFSDYWFTRSAKKTVDGLHEIQFLMLMMSNLLEKQAPRAPTDSVSLSLVSHLDKQVREMQKSMTAALRIPQRGKVSESTIDRMKLEKQSARALLSEIERLVKSL